MFKNQEFLSLPEGLLITVFSMVLVFLALLLISFIIDIMRVMVEKKDKKNAEPVKSGAGSAVNTSSAVKNDDEGEIAAVLSAAVAAMEDEESEVVAAISAAVAIMLGKSTGDFVVKNIKRVPELDTAWAKAGRAGLMR